jgi:tRNA A37 threonylcarbamoyladenosine synthetase subunit TsaC/SUA5/YrdC
MRSEEHQFVGDFSTKEDIYAAADLMRDGRALAVDNDTVFAIWGDGANQAFIDDVDRAKGRDPNRPYGLSLNCADFLSLIDVDQVHDSIRPLVADPDKFRNRLGAITFVRAPLDQKRAEERGLPKRLLSGPEQAPIGQNWSPEGKDKIWLLLRRAGLACAAVTSLNKSAEPEITTLEGALRFSKENDLPILGDKRARRKARGSYPIIDINGSDPVTGAERTAIHVVRARAKGIGSALLRRLLVGVPLITTASEDALPGIDPPELKGLSGPELREGLLRYLGWAAVHTD